MMMKTKISLFISIPICVLLLNGCFFVPVPKGTSDTVRVISTESIEKIVRDQFVPATIHHITRNRVVIFFKKDACPCIEKIGLSMKVSEVNSKGIKGFVTVRGRETNLSSRVDRHVDPELCKTFTSANEIINEAQGSSITWSNFYPPSYNLVWEAQQALRPPECDSIRAKILAEKAKQIAEDEGAKAVGNDITGTWVSKITSNHPDYFNKKEQRNLTLIIDERGNQITATDSSGKATLEAYRIEGYPLIKFKFSSPLASINQLEGTWEVIDGSAIEGSWNDPISNASGKWNLRKTGRRIKAQKIDKNIHKHLQEWLSQRPPLEVKWEEIDEIEVWTKEVDFMLCWMFLDSADCVNKN